VQKGQAGVSWHQEVQSGGDDLRAGAGGILAMNKNLQRREIFPETRVIDAQKGICEYVASDQTLDYSREIIKASGWRFTNFKHNAPFVDSHDYGTVGKLLGKVINFRVEGSKLIEQVQWAIDIPGHTLAQLGWALTSGGYLKSCSVGFYPTSMVSKWDDEKAWTTAIRELALDAETAGKVRCIYLEQEQIELSSCIIGCNPSALLRGYKDGAVSDELMERSGFGQADEFNFLTDAATVFDTAPEQVRSVVRAAMARIFAGSAKTLHENQTQKAPEAHQTAEADGADDRRRGKAFMEEFKQLIKNP
jgi:hypothetical protein